MVAPTHFKKYLLFFLNRQTDPQVYSLYLQAMLLNPNTSTRVSLQGVIGWDQHATIDPGNNIIHQNVADPNKITMLVLFVTSSSIVLEI